MMHARRACSACARWCSSHSRRVYVDAFRDVATAGLEGAMQTSMAAVPPVPPMDRDWRWEADNAPGTNYVTLERMDGNVNVRVLASLSFEDPSLHGGRCAEIYKLVVLLTTVKGCLRLECISTEGQLRVRSGSTFPAVPGDPAALDAAIAAASDMGVPADVERDSVYHVPDWDDQADAVLTGFHAYLEEVGINDAFLEYVASLLQHKETMEYAGWWAKVSSFVSPGADCVPAAPEGPGADADGYIGAANTASRTPNDAPSAPASTDASYMQDHDPAAP